MNDHFKDCKIGDVVTVTMRGRVTHTSAVGPIVQVSGFLITGCDPSIIAVTIEPRIPSEGDRVIWKGELRGTVKLVHGDVACVLYDDDVLDVSRCEDLELLQNFMENEDDD